jgi:hypothetical protein
MRRARSSRRVLGPGWEPLAGGDAPARVWVESRTPYRTGRFRNALRKRILMAIGIDCGDRVGGEASAQTLLGRLQPGPRSCRSFGEFPGIGRPLAPRPLHSGRQLPADLRLPTLGLRASIGVLMPSAQKLGPPRSKRTRTVRTPLAERSPTPSGGADRCRSVPGSAGSKRGLRPGPDTPACRLLLL